MARSFETSAQHASFHLKPLSVPIRIESVFEEARNQVEDLAGWSIVKVDEASHTLVCERAGGLLSGPSTVTIVLSGPEGLPSTTVNVKSESSSGLLARDRANVLEFMTPFHRRVC